MNNKECKWTYNHKDQDWETECGRKIADEETNGTWKYCPWCGGLTVDIIPEKGG